MSSGAKRILFFQSQAGGCPRGEILGASQSTVGGDKITLVAHGLIVRVFPKNNASEFFSGIPNEEVFDVIPGRPVNLTVNTALERIGRRFTGDQSVFDFVFIPVMSMFCPCCC